MSIPPTIWIEHRTDTHATLWDTRYYEAYTLVDGDHMPLLDATGQEYRLDTIAQAKAKIQELLASLLNARARAYAESQAGPGPLCPALFAGYGLFPSDEELRAHGIDPASVYRIHNGPHMPLPDYLAQVERAVNAILKGGQDDKLTDEEVQL